MLYNSMSISLMENPTAKDYMRSLCLLIPGQALQISGPSLQALTCCFQ